MKKRPKNQEMIDVFTDTKEKADQFSQPNSVKSTVKIEEPLEINRNIVVENTDTVSAIHKYGERYNLCALNMASAKHAGGGVENGAKAQEEALFRCSNLHTTVTQDMYPLAQDDLIYSYGVTFFKDFHYEDHEPTECSVVTIPAINLNKKSFYDDALGDYVDMIEGKPVGYETMMKSKIRVMLMAAYQDHCDCIILGAWGCGVFKNKPEDVARFFKEVLVDEGAALMFEKVVFAIINDRNSHGNNFEVFKDIVEPKQGMLLDVL